MANELRRKLVASKTIKNGGDAGITLASLAAGSWRQCVKLDLFGAGTPFPAEIEIRVTAKPTSAPTAGGQVRFFFGYSSSGTAATGNPAGLSGADAAYVGYGAAAGDADECMGQLFEAAPGLIASADAVIQVGLWTGPFEVHDRYLVGAIRNGTSVALSSTESDHVVDLRVWTYEIQ
jgi:hypothetical protein